MSTHADSHPPIPLAYGAPNARVGPYVQVLLSYLRRPAFWVLAIALAASSLLITGIDAFQHFFWFRNSTWGFEISNSLPWLFFVMLSFNSPLALAFVFVIILAVQTREQFTNWRAQVVPGFRKPHARIGTGLFCLVAVALAVTMYVQSPRGVSLIGTVAIFLMPLTLIVWIGVRGSVWVVLVAVVVCVVVAAEPHIRGAIGSFLEFLGEDRRWGAPAVNIPRILASVVLIAANVLLILWAMHGARPAASGAVRRRFPLYDSAGRAPDWIALHRELPPPSPVVGLWSRVWHRRLGVLRPWSAAWVGGLLALILIVILYVSGTKGRQSAVLLALMLATLTPGLVSAAIGAERWPLLGVESLFPSPRRAFVREMGLVMAINFAEFWLAGMVAAVIAIAAFSPHEIASTSFGMTVVASALTQVLLFGGLFLLGASRSAVPYLIGVSLLMIGVAMPLEMAWAPMPELSVQSLLRISVAEAVLGIVLLLFARNVWGDVELG